MLVIEMVVLGTGGNIGEYIVGVVIAGVFIAIRWLAGPAFAAFINAGVSLMDRAEA